MILTADQLWAERGHVYKDAGVWIDGERVGAVGSREALCDLVPGGPHHHLDGCCLMPGLINAHCHLELSALASRRPVAADFVDWILALVEEKRHLDPDTAAAAAAHAVEELAPMGVTGIGDIQSIPLALEPLARSGLRVRVDVEVLGRDPDRAIEIMHRMVERWERTRNVARDHWSVGIAPHAPYTISETLWRHLARWQSRHAAPLTVHVAESQEEVTFLDRGRGPFLDRFLPAVGWRELPLPGGGETPVTVLENHGLLQGAHLIHAAHLGTEEAERVARAGCAITHCPRSNGYLGQPRAPVARWLGMGIPVGLGTDSLASNLSLDLWEEMRFAYLWHRSGPEPLSATDILHMATAGSARALGWQQTTGRLAAGMAADLIAVDIGPSAADRLSECLIADGCGERVRLNLVAGQVVWQAPEVELPAPV